MKNLNNSQLELLKVLNYMNEESDLAEIKSLLIAYLSDKVVRSADKAFDEKNYTTEIFDNRKLEHFRKSAKTLTLDFVEDETRQKNYQHVKLI